MTGHPGVLTRTERSALSTPAIFRYGRRRSTPARGFWKNSRRSRLRRRGGPTKERIDPARQTRFGMHPPGGQNFEGVGSIIASVVQDLTVRNETLKIADEHPGVFQFLDNKSKSDLLKVTDPRLSEFLEAVKPKEESTTRKRKLGQPAAPFRCRHVTKTEGRVSAESAGRKDIGGGNAHATNELLSTGAVQKVAPHQVPSLHIHPLSVATDSRHTMAGAREIASAQAQERSLSHKWPLSAQESRELQYWTYRLDSPIIRSLMPSGVELYDKVLQTDASAHSVGAILLDAQGNQLSTTHRELPQNLILESSTARELFAIVFGLSTFASHIDSGVLVNTDSQAASVILRKGSISLTLHELAETVWDIEQREGINIIVKWIPREQNLEADWASRLIDYDDWRISNTIFERLSNRWGNPNIDMFANDRNTKCEMFFSSFPCPNTAGVDAFMQVSAWTNGFLWLVPPVSLVSKALKWARFYGSRGILGCPLWFSQSFYPILKPDAPRFEEGAALATVADRLGLQNVSRTIYKALRSDRASSTFACYSAELRKFLSWKGSDALAAIPLEKAHNLYLAKCAHEGRNKSLPVLTAALNYFCGPLTGVDLDIQQSILEAERRSSPETTHRTKIDQQSMRRLVLEGLDSADYKVTQAAALALLQFKAFLRISEAQALRSVDLTFVGGGYYSLKIRKSKTDQAQVPRGGAASLALSLGAEQTAVMLAGRWKTINAFRCYVAPKAIPLPTDPTFSAAPHLSKQKDRKAAQLTLESVKPRNMRMLTAAVFASLLWIAHSGKLQIELHRDKCYNADLKDGDLFIRKVHIIAVNNETRRKQFNWYSGKCDYKPFVDPVLKLEGNFDFHASYFKDAAFVVGFLVQRGKETRENDNPMVFVHSDYETCGGESVKIKTGSGSDFSKMYSNSPFRPGRIVVNVYEDDWTFRKTLVHYEPPADCYATDTWIANEGFYLVDPEMKVLYPIYYDMWADDVFIM
ncbi:unnamed protein product [Cylicocyclus nassatus]|uniref:RNase H type-1 domain-containing protein n=1 Tax=Cylicocyclus nassatus TaxID=53992 RepID=A0AA36HCL6_CYLNA|nr:unnamed protein product [Cylicocyclus nassatus]